MHRRDFLLLRHPMSPRTVELSCERLHMSYLDAQAVAAPPLEDGPSFSEPAISIRGRDVDEWLRELESALQDVEVIRLSGAEWLRPDDLRARVEAMLARLEQRGIRVER